MAEDQATPSPQDQFAKIVSDFFGTTKASALEAYTKITSFMASNPNLTRTAGSSDDFDDLVERVKNQLVGMDLRAILNQVALPLFGGVLVGTALAVFAGVPALTAGLIGLLVALVLWLFRIHVTMADITATLSEVFAELKQKIDQIMDLAG